MLAEDKRSGLKLATELAALQGNISVDVQLALREVVDPAQEGRQKGLEGKPMLLRAIGRPVVDGLLIHLQDKAGNERGIVLYLPGDPRQALRFFDNVASMNSTVAMLLQDPGYWQFFTQLISLEHRAGFVSTLGKRLKDKLPDLELEGETPGEGFSRNWRLGKCNGSRKMPGCCWYRPLTLIAGRLAPDTLSGRRQVWTW